MKNESESTSNNGDKNQIVVNESGMYFAGDGWIFDVQYAKGLTYDEAVKVIQDLRDSDSRVGLNIKYAIFPFAVVLEELDTVRGPYVLGLPQREGHPALMDDDGGFRPIHNLPFDLVGLARFTSVVDAEGATLNLDDFEEVEEPSNLKIYKIVSFGGNLRLVEMKD